MSAPVIKLNSEIDSLNDIENIAKTTFQHCQEMLGDIVTYSTDRSGDLTKLKMHMNTLCESQKEIAGLIYATNELYNLTGKVNLTEEQATEKFQEVLDEYIEENDIDDNQREILLSLDTFINENQVSENQNKDDDDEVLVTETTQSYKDPLTQRIMKDPVKSKNCNHSYERDSIMKYLADSKKKCPYSGCQSVLTKRDLVDDIILKVKLSVKIENT